MFYSSRNQELKASFEQAILSPLASDGGLFCPSAMQPVRLDANASYLQVAQAVCEGFHLAQFAAPITAALEAYEQFDGAKPLAESTLCERFVCELWHGPTRAFKDLALAPLARLCAQLAGDEQLLICCATSGDTGPATLEAFSDVARVVCIYPEGKTSAAQRAQMIAPKRANALVLGISGNFDDAQSALKQLLNDAEFNAQIAAKKLRLGAANSLNFGRILYQCIYHFAASLKRPNARVVVPSGNFGNALAAFYAKELGAPIAEIKVVCNENRLLADFFSTGRYDLQNRAFKTTASPAMDILRPSNLERLIAYRLGCQRAKECYESLDVKGYFELSKSELDDCTKGFSAACVDDAACLETIAQVRAKSGEIIDPHTACAFAASAPGDVIASTAEWVKFAPTIAKALGEGALESAEQEAAFVEKFAPQNALCALIRSSENHARFIDASEIKRAVREWL